MVRYRVDEESMLYVDVLERRRMWLSIIHGKGPRVSEWSR